MSYPVRTSKLSFDNLRSYAYTFELNSEWKQFYSGSDEIQEYIEKTCKKYGGDRFIKFKHRVSHAVWDEHAGKWHIKVEHEGRVFDDECDVL